MKRPYDSRRWRDLRKQVFVRDFYICQMCGDICIGQGRSNPLSPECDHIQPHNNDPALMWDMANLQTLHKKCHSIKTSIEDGGLLSGADTNPEWLPAPGCKVVLVCGPAAGGKTTWAKAQAKYGDEVIDLDDCFTLVCGEHGHTADRKHLSAAIRVRNKMLANLSRKRKGTAYVIVSAPTQAERDWWQDKLGAEVELICPSIEDIDARDVSARRKELARGWFAKAIMGNWKPKKRRETIGLDGWPV